LVKQHRRREAVLRKLELFDDRSEQKVEQVEALTAADMAVFVCEARGERSERLITSGGASGLDRGGSAQTTQKRK